MTIAEIIRKNPEARFVFFENGAAVSKAPFLHGEVKGFEKISGTKTVFVYL